MRSKHSMSSATCPSSTSLTVTTRIPIPTLRAQQQGREDAPTPQPSSSRDHSPRRSEAKPHWTSCRSTSRNSSSHVAQDRLGHEQGVRLLLNETSDCPDFPADSQQLVRHSRGETAERLVEEAPELRLRRLVASAPNGLSTRRCYGMQEVRGSNPLSSTPGQPPNPAQNAPNPRPRAASRQQSALPDGSGRPRRQSWPWSDVGRNCLHEATCALGGFEDGRRGDHDSDRGPHQGPCGL